MKNEIETLKQIRHQIAHCMAFYGDNPEELMYKLETLVIEWYDKGQNQVNITCPHCHTVMTVYHMEWSALACLQCKAEIKQPYGQTFVEK